MEHHQISFLKSGHVFTHGDLNSNSIVLLFHGYAQLATEFAESFLSITGHSTIIAPEASSYFYKKGLRNDVGASWMTSRHRNFEIDDYLCYLDNVSTQFDLSNKVVSVIAFSQGVSTCLRWLQHSGQIIDQLFLIAGVFPDDVTFDTLKFNKAKYFYGNDDRLIRKETIVEWDNKLAIPFLEYEGGHEINEQLLTLIKNDL